MRRSGAESLDEVTQDLRLEAGPAVESQNARTAQVDLRLLEGWAVEHRGTQWPALLGERAAGEGPLRLHPARGRVAVDEHDSVTHLQLILLGAANLIGRGLWSDGRGQGGGRTESRKRFEHLPAEIAVDRFGVDVDV